MWDLMGWILIILVTGALAFMIGYFYKSTPTVPNGSTILHYHPVSAHTIYKKDTK